MKSYTLHDLNQFTDSGPKQVALVSGVDTQDAFARVRAHYASLRLTADLENLYLDRATIYLYNGPIRIAFLELREVKK